MPLFEVGALSTLMEGEIATAALADTMSTAALADVGMGAGTGLAGLAEGATGAGGVASLPGALTSQLANIGAVNPEIAAQVADFANMGQIPSAGTQLGAGQIGSPGIQGLGAGQIGSGIQALPSAAPQIGQVAAEGAVQGAPAASQISPAQAAYNRSLTASLSPATVTDVGGSGVDILPPREGVIPPADKYANLTSGNFGPSSAIPIQNPAFTPPVEGMLDAATGKIPETPGIGSYFSKAYNAWENSNPLIKYGLPAMGAMKYLNKTPGAYSPPGYSGPLSKINISPNYRPYSYRPYAAGGPVEEMSRENAIGANTGYPQADINQGAYATPWQTPVSRNVVTGSSDDNVDQMTGEERLAQGGIARFDGGGAASSGGDAQGAADDGGIAPLAYSPSMYGPMMYSPSMMSSSLVDPAQAYAESQPTMEMSRQNFQNFLSGYSNLPGLTKAEIDEWSKAHPPAQAYSAPVSEGVYTPDQGNPPIINARAGGIMASGGISTLGGYSDGGRLLKGPGDGMSDNIPASISGKQPARLADGEFVVPADVVSGLGNGSTDAGARHLYSMMDKVRKARTGTKKQGKQINPRKYMPA